MKMTNTILKQTFSSEVEKRMADKEYLRNYISDFPTDKEKLSFMDGIDFLKKSELTEYPLEIRTELSFVRTLADKYYLEIQLNNTDEKDCNTLKYKLKKINEKLNLYKKGYIPGETYNPNEIIKTIEQLQEKNKAHALNIKHLQKNIGEENKIKDKYISDYQPLMIYYSKINDYLKKKTEISWIHFKKRYSLNKEIRATNEKAVRQLEEIKKYDRTLDVRATPEQQREFLLKSVSIINEKIRSHEEKIVNLSRFIQTNELLIDKNTRRLKQYQVDAFGISMDSIDNINEISDSHPSTLVTLMKKESGERLEQVRRHYYELITNCDMYDGIYPYHLKDMQYPSDIVAAVEEIYKSNDCYDERRQIENTTMLCKKVMQGATLEEIMSHKDDVANDIENLFALNSRFYAKPKKSKGIEMSR